MVSVTVAAWNALALSGRILGQVHSIRNLLAATSFQARLQAQPLCVLPGKLPPHPTVYWGLGAALFSLHPLPVPQFQRYPGAWPWAERTGLALWKQVRELTFLGGTSQDSKNMETEVGVWVARLVTPPFCPQVWLDLRTNVSTCSRSSTAEPQCTVLLGGTVFGP